MFFIINYLKNKVKGVPWLIILTTMALLTFGLINLYSATNAGITPERFYNQIFFIMVGFLGVFIIGIFLDFKTIEDLAIPIYVFVCILLVVVDFFGRAANGAERWIAIGNLRLQPSEFAKIGIILAVAKSLQNTIVSHEFAIKNLWKQTLIILLPIILIIKQPDLGTASLVFLIACFQIATLPISKRTLTILTFIGVSCTTIAWNFILHDYQKQRVLTFINPMLDPKGSGYQSLQSMIAVGSGRVGGVGFGEGSQGRLKFLPERHTDFAFSVWAEEQGFVGSLIFIVLYFFLILQIFQIANKAKDSFSTLIVVGVGAFFILHFIINISMVLGIFPVVGVPLTLFSYGGTHMITALCALGLVIATERKRFITA